MSDENKTEDFEEQFDNDDFAFLDEEEITPSADAAPPQTIKNNTRSTFSKKIMVAASSVIVIGTFVFYSLHKKPHKETIIPLAKAQIEKTDQTITIPGTPQKSTINKDNATNNIATLKNDDNNSTTESDKLINNGNNEKSREEMADLFASSAAEQTNNLENAIAAQQTKTGNSEKISPNMDLYFGNNVPHNKLDKKSEDPNTKEISKQTAQLQHAVESITQEMTDNVNQLKQLETKLNEVTDLLAKVNQNIGNMDARMLGLTETVDSITQDVSNVKKVIANEDLDVASTAHKTKADTLTYQPPGYSIHAIIPGRAWLKAASGQIITIAEGDVIGDYGTVAVIDAANNIVRTSSGVSFR